VTGTNVNLPNLCLFEAVLLISDLLVGNMFPMCITPKNFEDFKSHQVRFST